MNSVFQWTRQRRRLSSANCNINSTIKATEYVTFGCCCKDQKASDRQPVTEIVVTDEIICILRSDGIGKALDKSTHREICQLNASPYSAIRSISYNHVNNTIILVCHSRIFNTGLTVSIHCPKRIKQGDTTPIESATEFQNLLVPFPGFIEFEEQNGRIITSTPFDNQFCFWDMRDYSSIFSVNNDLYKEIRISRGTVALFKQPQGNRLYVKLCNIINGETLSDLELLLAPNRDLKFLELCGCYLLVKQEGACLRVHDLIDDVVQKIPGTRNFCPKAVTFFTDGLTNNIKPTKGPTIFLAVHECLFEVCVCADGRLVTVMTIKAEIPQEKSDCLQVVQQEQLLLVYTKNPDAYFDLREGDNSTPKKKRQQPGRIAAENKPLMLTAVCRTREENTSVNRMQTKTKGSNRLFPLLYSMLEDPCLDDSTLIVPSTVSLVDLKNKNKRNGCAGVTIIDLETARRIGFVPLTCDHEINVLAFDPMRREVLAGGARGLHRMCSKFKTTVEIPEVNEKARVLRLFRTPLAAQCHTPSYRNAISRTHLPSSSSLTSSDLRLFLCGRSPSDLTSLLEMVRLKSYEQSKVSKRGRCLHDSPDRRYPKRQRKQIERLVIRF